MRQGPSISGILPFVVPDMGSMSINYGCRTKCSAFPLRRRMPLPTEYYKARPSTSEF